MANVVDYLNSIQKLTDTNLQILKALNDSFYTKQNHLYAKVDDSTYVIPSFLSLENKINMLQENFENLVKAPETAEAYFNFDGNTRSIEVRKYSHVPDSVKLPIIENFGVNSNDIFKDFMTPVPYINLDLPSLPNDIVEVNVKKIVAKHDALKEVFKNKLSYTETITNDDDTITTLIKYHKTNNANYGDIYKLLLDYKDGIDYAEYDTIYKLPLRKNIGSGLYVIESVVSDIIDEDLNELITLKLRNNLTDVSYMNTLTYKVFNDTIEKPLAPGDELLNFDGTGKVRIVEVRTSTNTIVVKVVNGEYLNFLGTDSYDSDNDTDIHDFSKLRFHAVTDFSEEKYVKVPLEEDQYVFIAVAPVNSRMNIQANWGQGLLLDTYKLMDESGKKSFKDYYDENVKNLGDALFEITSMATSRITDLSEDDFNQISSIKPKLIESDIKVMQINKHLNNSTTVKNIRSAYEQKKAASIELEEVQTKIDDINNNLTSISFDDTTGMRSIYTSQLTQLNNRKNTLTNTITKAIDNISLNVNSAEIPIENAKYRIRGFYVPTNFGQINGEELKDHVIGIRVQYRYKNTSAEIGSAISMAGSTGKNYIYSDWNVMTSIDKNRIAEFIDGEYKYKYEPSNEDKNEPSYNQIDIPISQGENVDIRVKVLYDFGQPYITVESAWSDIINIAFPEEFTKDVPILTIIEENNNDIEINRFNNILKEEGIDTHINDQVTDQDITYYHKPDNIASGFYTDERRIIPLKDKLINLSNDIAELKNEVYGSEGLLNIGISVGDDLVLLNKDQDNTITLEEYNAFFSEVESDGTLDAVNAINNGAYVNNGDYVATVVNIIITNSSDKAALKIYPIFPGSRNVSINDITFNYIKKDSYIVDKTGGVWFRFLQKNNEDKDNKLQTQNQFITFRANDLWTGIPYYNNTADAATDNIQNSSKLPLELENNTNKNWMIAYPLVTNENSLCINSDNSKSYFSLSPGEEIVVPIYCAYSVPVSNGFIRKTISFDIRTSLYNDPVNYTFTITAKNTASIQDKILMTNRKRFNTSTLSLSNLLKNSLKYSTTVK